MIILISFGILALLWVLFLVMSGSLVYHFFKYSVEKTYYPLVIVFALGSLGLFVLEFYYFQNINWEELQKLLFDLGL